MNSKLEGDWDKIIKSLDGAGHMVMEGARLGLHQGALLLEKAIVGHLQNQDLGWQALNAAYKAWKERKKLSNQIGIATATMMNSITTVVMKDGDEIFVGANRQKKRADGEDPVLIAEVFEYGSVKRNIIARPLMRPSFVQTIPQIQKRVEINIEKSLKKLADLTGAAKG